MNFVLIGSILKNESFVILILIIMWWFCFNFCDFKFN
ncbi:Hypothetical protein WEOB_138 [Candidatus Westeberhardia cardiocondylae]|uniref:Uncharacterized protein n=1 Tax=Candidatus Westeberhardia cardiocondylae TaxID=1594731 RepID=A0A0H5BWJ5_9ENTR|nr:Hypothetical protein WEOB_138 [Candidatus Westeberhardia cardiocondylae]